MYNNLLEKLLKKAKLQALQYEHNSVSIEHFCVALFDEEKIKNILEKMSVNKIELEEKFINYLKNQEKHITNKEDLNISYLLQKVLQKSMFQSLSLGKNEANHEDFLVAMIQEEESYASYLLKQAGLNSSLLEYSTKEVDYFYELDSLKSLYKQDSYLSLYALNLNEYIEKNSFHEILEREDELNRAMLILSRKNKSNPLFVGDEGVGKTVLVYALAKMVVEKKAPQNLLKSKFFLLNLTSLLAGTKYRGDFENRLKLLLDEVKENKDIIIVIDEIHMLIGAGTSFSSSLDAANILKPALADGSLRCIGMTTFKEYRNYFEKDKALSRRFQKIDVLEPSEKSCLKILQSLKKHYESFHDVIIEDNIFDEIIELSNKYLHERKMPDKVIDVLDESCALVKLNFSNIKNKIVNKNAVERAIALMTNSPSLHVEKSSKYLLENLSAILKKNIFGQDEAVESIVQAILLAYSDLKNINKPVANFLFMGPTGVGKTEIAKVLAKELNIKLIRFDMSEYMNTHDLSKLIGSAPGYVGYENGGLLTEKIQQNPYCVLLLDEIEKAHHDIFNILLQIMDYGKLTDSHGRSINFKDVIIIMTCNTDNTKNIGFITNKLKQNNKDNQCFSVEFKNRLDKIIYFKNLDKDSLLKIINKLLDELALQLQEKNIYLTLSNSAKEYLLEQSYDPLMGARPLRRTIDELIKKPLSYKILFENLSDKIEVFIDVQNNSLNIQYNST